MRAYSTTRAFQLIIADLRVLSSPQAFSAPSHPRPQAFSSLHRERRTRVWLTKFSRYRPHVRPALDDRGGSDCPTKTVSSHDVPGRNPPRQLCGSRAHQPRVVRQRQRHPLFARSAPSQHPATLPFAAASHARPPGRPRSRCHPRSSQAILPRSPRC